MLLAGKREQLIVEDREAVLIEARRRDPRVPNFGGGQFGKRHGLMIALDFLDCPRLVSVKDEVADFVGHVGLGELAAVDAVSDEFNARIHREHGAGIGEQAIGVVTVRVAWREFFHFVFEEPRLVADLPIFHMVRRGMAVEGANRRANQAFRVGV